MADAPADNVKRLIKFMGMTTSSNEGEALTALRMANRELASLGKSWEELLRGKITIIGDPFGNIQAPPESGRREPPRANPPPPPPYTAPPRQAPSYAPKPRPAPTAKPAPQPAAKPSGPRRNAYGGQCCACNLYVGQQSGFIRKDPITDRWNIVCNPCFTAGKSPLPKPTAPPLGGLA